MYKQVSRTVSDLRKLFEEPEVKRLIQRSNELVTNVSSTTKAITRLDSTSETKGRERGGRWAPKVDRKTLIEPKVRDARRTYGRRSLVTTQKGVEATC